MFRIVLVASLAAILVTPASAEDYTAGSLKVAQPWARATPKGAAVGGGYFKITNTGAAPDKFIGGSVGISSGFEVHEVSMENGVMKMRMLPGGIEIKPGETVTLKPGGYHIMFTGLKQPLKQGETFKATLHFEKAGNVDVDFQVEGIGAAQPGAGNARGGGHMKH